MPCFHPLKAWRSTERTKNGKQGITFNRRAAFVDLPLDLPCGQCIGCRLERSRQWAVRCVHELRSHESSCFLTLTYDADHLPQGGTLVKKHVQDFFKRYRKKYGKLRYFYCGEYGEKGSRPHYHAIIFGHDFVDKRLWRDGDNPLFVSPSLAALWPYGFSSIGAVTFESCAYVSRYVTKKVTGDLAAAHYGDRIPEFVDMSRRPGIASDFAKRYGNEILDHDSVVVRGIEMRPPRYYEKIYDTWPDDKKMQLEKNKYARIKYVSQLEKTRDQSPERKWTREQVVKLNLKDKLKRSYENE